MINKILVVGFACLSLAAVAQSDSNKKKDTEAVTTASPRDAVSGQATGKRQHKPLMVTAEEGANAATSSKPEGTSQPNKKSASDDWQAKSSATGTPAVKPVSTGDLDGDGKVSVKPAVSSSPSEVKSPRDLASGQASGKRAQQQPAPSTKPATDPAPKK